MHRNQTQGRPEEEDVPFESTRPSSPLTAREFQAREAPRPLTSGATPSREHRGFEDEGEDAGEKVAKKGKARKAR